jgi:hypothetical protein
MQKVEGNIMFHTATSTAFPQPHPGAAPSPGPMKVPAEQLRSLLGLTSVEYLQGQHSLATFRRKIAVFDPAILCSEGDGSYLAVSFGFRSTIPGAAPLTTYWLAVGPGDGRC